MSRLNVKIAIATAEDVPALEAVAVESMRDDKQTQFKLLAKDPSVSDDGTKPPIADWIDSPRIEVVKAVDEKTGDIIGCLCWASSRAMSTEAPQPEAATTTGQPPAEEPETVPAPVSAVDKLNAFSSAHFDEWMDKTMPPGTRCMFVCTIAVRPKYHGQGVGTGLIQWGTEQADAKGVFCWVHASEAGYPVFSKQGFEVDDVLEIDLDGYAREVDNEQVRSRKWGKYSLRYMIRQARKQ